MFGSCHARPRRASSFARENSFTLEMVALVSVKRSTSRADSEARSSSLPGRRSRRLTLMNPSRQLVIDEEEFGGVVAVHVKYDDIMLMD